MNSCPSCESNHWENFRRVKREKVFQNFKICKKCLLIRNESCFTQKQLSRYYKESYNTKNYQADNSIIFNRMLIPSKHRINILKNNNFNFLAGQNLLEIGPGSGSMLYLFSKMGLKIKAIEPDPIAASWLEKYLNITVINKFFNEWVNEKKNKKIEQSFDWIVLTHVLEHIKYPNNFLIDLSKFLSKSGKIIIEVPNANNPYSDGKDWGHLFDPGHFYYFNKKNLSKLIYRSGLKIDFITDSTMRPYKNILSVVSINFKEITSFKPINNKNYAIFKMKALWKIFEIKHFLKEFFFKKPGRFIKNKMIKFLGEKK